MGRFAFLTVALVLVCRIPDVSGQDSDEVKLLKKEIELLQSKLESANLKIKNLEKELAARSQKKEEETKKPNQPKTLSDYLTVDTVLNGTWKWNNNNEQHTAKITITERKGNAFKADYLVPAKEKGKADFAHEVSGTIIGDNISMKSISAAKPFMMKGSLNKDGYLDLEFDGPAGKAKMKYKVK